MEYKPSENDQFIFTPFVSFQDNSNSYLNDAQTTDDENVLINTSTNRYASDLNGYNLGGNLLWMHRFTKKGRTISINARGNASNNYHPNYSH